MMQAGATAASQRPNRVVILDGCSTRLHGTAELVKSCNYDVVGVCDSVNRAAEALAKEPADIVLTASRVDGKNAAALMSEMRARAPASAAVAAFIVVGDENADEDMLTALEAGAAEYLVHPLARNVVQNIWTHAWKRRRAMANSHAEAAAATAAGGGAGEAKVHGRTINASSGAGGGSDGDTDTATIALKRVQSKENVTVHLELNKTTTPVHGPEFTNKPRIGSAFSAFGNGGSIIASKPPAPNASARRTTQQQKKQQQQKQQDKKMQQQVVTTEHGHGHALPPQLPQHHATSARLNTHSASAIATHMGAFCNWPPHPVYGGLGSPQCTPPPEVMTALAAAVAAATAGTNGVSGGGGGSSIGGNVKSLPSHGQLSSGPDSTSGRGGGMDASTSGSDEYGNASASRTAREHRLEALRKYREKRKTRTFDKKVRYESRKRVAQGRPRYLGRFVKISEMEADKLQADVSVVA